MRFEERIEFNNANTRNEFFKLTKEHFGFLSWREFYKKFNIARTVFQNYRFGILTLPKSFFDKLFEKIPEQKHEYFLSNISLKNPNWGAIKGGSASRKFANRNCTNRKFSEATLKKLRENISKLNVALKEIEITNPEKYYMLLREKKLRKNLAKLEIVKLEPKEVIFDNSNINFSINDKRKSLILPNTLDEDLAEEIGIHLGDGTLFYSKPTGKYYFSVRGGYDEEEYYRNFILPLYKKLYNLDLPLLKRSLACGFEVSSKALYEFKTKTLGICSGVKTYKADVPKAILESNDAKIMRAFLRGAFDTDGCVYFHKKRKYPVISIMIKSEKIIAKIDFMLKQLGFKPATHYKSYMVALNGVIMFKKWDNEIGSSNPKNIKRFDNIKSLLPWSNLDKLFRESKLFS